MSDEGHPHEIFIIKRHGGGHEEAHHGGAWKIAYADFVTAMMAFFLVMWLISANDKTKAVIARYFNPVQLVDSTPQPPGLNDPKAGAPNVPQKTGGKPVPEAKEARDAARDAKPAEKPRKDEADLFKNPEETLSDIVTKDGVSARPPARVASDNPRNGATTSDAAGQKGGEAFRDPFEPQAAIVQDAQADVTPIPAPARIDGPVPPAAPPPKGLAEKASDLASEPLPAEPRARAAELKNRIDAVMKSLAAASAGPQPKVDVKATAEGLLIALTDDAKFAMFALASAEPAPRTVMLLERIGKLLKAQKGKVTIRGFTDSRKFRSETYDNWRLSSARAHMAHYMLARGGLDDARIERIEGYADRQPRNVNDPESPENRRIEILLREKP